MIFPNVLNAPLTGHPASFLLESAALNLSTTDFFRSWEPVPESAAMAFPSFNDAYGRQFRQEQVQAGDGAEKSIRFLRSSWALMASGSRRWMETREDTSGLPGDRRITLRSFSPSSEKASGKWNFEDGFSLPRRFGSVEFDDQNGRLLKIRQDSPKSDLTVRSGWTIGSYDASIWQETSVSPQGRVSVVYGMDYGRAFLKGLQDALGLSGRLDTERSAMRLAALIERGGQFASVGGPFLLERGEGATHIGFMRRQGTSVTSRRDRIALRIRPDGSSGSYALHPSILEKLWNPLYVRALAQAFGELPSA